MKTTRYQGQRLRVVNIIEADGERAYILDGGPTRRPRQFEVKAKECDVHRWEGCLSLALIVLAVVIPSCTGAL
jgi:hypothetical protein